MHILVVDDVPMMRELLCTVAAAAFDPAEIRSGDDLAGALVIAQGMPKLDLVLLDLGLPDCQGTEGLARFRQAFPKSRIVVVSSTEDESAIEDVLDAGASGFIPKGLEPSAMVAALRVIVDGSAYRPTGPSQRIGKKP
jgi:DNA-binding NarL/FixJ family response regulator